MAGIETRNIFSTVSVEITQTFCKEIIAFKNHWYRKHLREHPAEVVAYEYEFSGEASPTFGHANANFSVFIDRI